MKADSISLQEFFHHERRHLVPLYQRPYVWKQDEQWEPLWEDIRQLAERTLAGQKLRPHFLGAIVLDQMNTPTRDIAARLVIDGQQRLTTLQLLLAAFRDLCGELGDEDLQRRLDRLTRNEDVRNPEDDQRFKVWPTNLDRGPFRAVLDPVGAKAEKLRRAREAATGSALIADAYAYFSGEIERWLAEDGEAAVPRRAETLLEVLRQRLNLVVIDLGDDDEAQVIFETLNARGTPLLPADLVKNFLFHAAEFEKAALDALYEKYWKPFDEGADYWRKQVKQGRFYRPQIDLFLQHYLTLQTRDEVAAGHLFSEFKEFAANRKGLKAEDHLRSLEEHARVFRKFSEAPLETPRGRFFHRLTVMDTTTVLPFLLGLFRRYDAAGRDAELDGILADIESFLVRRMVCELTTKNYNQLFVDMLGVLGDAADRPADGVRAFLLGQTAESRRWPTDAEFESAWQSLPAYKALSRPRLRMLLEALEAAVRSERSEDIVLRGRLTVEHLLPQSWEVTWPLPDGADPEQGRAGREALVHRFGNLTLLTKKLNPSVSNSAWPSKRKGILEHSALALNRWFHEAADWDEQTIEQRTEALGKVALGIWARPGAPVNAGVA